MIEIAILGYGVVGSGVFETINKNQKLIDKRAAQPIKVKYVLDTRDFPGNEVSSLLTKNFDDVLNDDSIKIVVETMGGLNPAYDFVKSLLLKGKSCVTSNKELVAAHGAELLKIARDQKVSFLFEASVGGGIPIIRPLNESLTADEVYEINGILNGTTNYILSKMADEGKSFEAALKGAQEKGYAEKNPENDIEGHDTCRKIAILLSLALGKQVDYQDIYTEGITKIDDIDIRYAKKLESSIKLMAVAKKIDSGIYARVSPVLIKNTHTMYTVNNVFNAIVVKGEIIGKIMFYGKGAGKLPTASAVVADIIDAAKHPDTNINQFWSTKKQELLNYKDIPVKEFIRLSYQDKEEAQALVKKIFEADEIIELDLENRNEFAFITKFEKEIEIDKKIQQLKSSSEKNEVVKIIRIQE